MRIGVIHRLSRWILLSLSVPFVPEYEYDIAPRHLRNDLSIEHRQPWGTLVLKYYNIIPPTAHPNIIPLAVYH